MASVSELDLYRQIRESFPIASYLPREKQHRYHNSPAQIRAFMGGNQSGKTTAGCAEDIAIGMGVRIWLPPDHPSFHVKLGNGAPMPFPSHMAITVPDLKNNLRDAFFPKLEELAPPDYYEIETDSAGLPSRLIWRFPKGRDIKWGSTITFLSNTGSDRKHESGTRHAVHHDEPPRRRVRIAHFRGLLRWAGLEMFTLTPLDADYLLNDLVMKADGNESIEIIEVDTKDNLIENGGVLDRRSYELFEEQMTEEERYARLHGISAASTRRCIPNFKSAYPWIVPAFDLPRDEWYRIMVVDPHETKPDCILWAAVHRHEGRAVIYDGVMDATTRGTIRQTCNRIRDLEERSGGPANRRLIDPRFGKKYLKNEQRTYQEEYERHGIYTETASAIRVYKGFKRLNQMFTMEAGEDAPTLQVFDHLKPVIEQFESLRWLSDPKTHELKDKTTLPDDFGACARYFALFDPDTRDYSEPLSEAPHEEDYEPMFKDESLHGSYTGY